jgi:hypothetical protein
MCGRESTGATRTHAVEDFEYVGICRPRIQNVRAMRRTQRLVTLSKMHARERRRDKRCPVNSLEGECE